jgi:hypothetical protein
MPDENPISRLEFAKGEIDRVFGRGFSRDHPELTSAVMLSASMDFAGLAVARAVRDVAAALLVEDAPAPGEGLLRPPTILR